MRLFRFIRFTILLLFVGAVAATVAVAVTFFLGEVNVHARARSHIVRHLQIIYCYFYWKEQRESFLLSLLWFDASVQRQQNRTSLLTFSPFLKRVSPHRFSPYHTDL